jgi:cytochrome P450
MTSVEFDHTSPEYVVAMHEWFARFRQDPGLPWSEAYSGFWIASRHADVTEMLHDHRTFISGPGIVIPPIASPVPSIPTESDAPEHTHYRRILWPFLTPKAVASYEPFVRSEVRRLIDAFIDAGEVEIVEAFSKPIPALVTGRFFGFDRDESLQCYEWLEDMFRLAAVDMDAALETAGKLFGFMATALGKAAANPGDDVVSAIVTGTVGDRPLTEAEHLGLMFTTLAGALETSVSAITYGVKLFGEHPEARAALKERPELIHGAVEEILRMSTPAHCPARTVASGCTFRRTELSPGDRVLLLLAAANYDETVFPEPLEFNIDRPNNQHVAFGYGVHKCEGQHLARLEIRVAMEELLRRIRAYEVTDEDELTIGTGVSGIKRLRIKFPTEG